MCAVIEKVILRKTSDLQIMGNSKVRYKHVDFPVRILFINAFSSSFSSICQIHNQRLVPQYGAHLFSSVKTYSYKGVML